MLVKKEKNSSEKYSFFVKEVFWKTFDSLIPRLDRWNKMFGGKVGPFQHRDYITARNAKF